MNRFGAAFAALWLLFSTAGTAIAESALEVIRLKHRTADQLLPALEPLLDKGGALSGQRNTIFLRTTPGNRDDIRRAIEALDVAQRRLTISVRIDNDASAESGGAAAGIRAGGAEARARAGAWSTRGDVAGRSDQRVQAVDGAQAYIRVGTSVLLPMQQVVYGAGGVVVAQSAVERDVGTGFYATPVLAGERVTLTVSPQQESLSPGGEGTIRSTRIVTTVSGRLGEWIELGASGVRSADARDGSMRLSTRGEQSRQRVLLRVDALD